MKASKFNQRKKLHELTTAHFGLIIVYLVQTIKFLNMKKVFALLTVISLVFISCEGDPGPPGPPGLDGQDGLDGLIGQVFEFEVDFNAANDFSALFEYPPGVEVFESDVILVYQLVAVDNGLDIWEPLPRTMFFQDGILLYGYDFSFVDINFFLDGTVDLTQLDPALSQNQVFRVAIVPAEFAQDLKNKSLETVMSALNVEKVNRIN